MKSKRSTRKLIAWYERQLKTCKNLEDREILINLISDLRPVNGQYQMGPELLPGSEMVVVEEPENLPTFGKLRSIIEKNYQKELDEFSNSTNNTNNDVKRLALKKVFMDYFNELDYGPEVIIVDYTGDMTLRRDDQDVDNTDFDFAPNKNKIYNMWMEELNRYARAGRLDVAELDEAAERGIPQGGAFEKQLDRHRQEIMKELWEDFYSQREDNQWMNQ